MGRGGVRVLVAGGGGGELTWQVAEMAVRGGAELLAYWVTGLLGYWPTGQVARSRCSWPLLASFAVTGQKRAQLHLRLIIYFQTVVYIYLSEGGYRPRCRRGPNTT